MSTKHTFTQAVAAREWYKATPASQELLRDLDKDLKKWNAHVSDESDDAQVCIVAEARFDRMIYRFTFRVHAPVEIKPIEQANVPPPYRSLLKTHLRARNVLKNFLPVVFDRLSAQQSFALVTMHGPGKGTSHCIWATNASGLGLSVVTTISPERVPVVVPVAKPPVEPIATSEPIVYQQAQLQQSIDVRSAVTN